MENLELDNLDILWITLINYGYIDYAKNFLKSMELSNVSFKLLIYCLDNETIEELKSYKNCICINADVFMRRRQKKAEKRLVCWKEQEYKELVFLKLDAMLYSLHRGRAINIKSVGYIDTDIVLVSDPTAIMTNIMNENPNISVFAQCDESGPWCSNRTNCPVFCSGVILFRNIPELYKYFVYDDSHIKICSGDQDYLYKMFKKFNVPVLTIEKHIFLNGSYFGINKITPCILPKSACLVHFNYRIGNAKKDKMKEHNMWYI